MSNSFDGGYHLYAKERHKTRVAKTPKRIDYALEQLLKHGIECCVKNEMIGHIHAFRKSDGQLMQFWAGTGKIMGTARRGIKNFIKLLEE